MVYVDTVVWMSYKNSEHKLLRKYKTENETEEKKNTIKNKQSEEKSEFHLKICFD